MITLTNRQARNFILLKHGLLDKHKFFGKQGALDFIHQTGCIQYDPVDSCGKNAELTLQSRVKNFTKQMLYELLYKERSLIDYPDKNLSIIPLDDWPYFERYRKKAQENGLRFENLAGLEIHAKKHIQKNGAVSSDELPIVGDIHWHSSIHWSGSWDGKTNAARAVLEQLYSTGELIIHHKKGTRKYYDLAEKYISEELLYSPDPFPDEFEHQKWRVLRRIGAVGLLWNRPSDAWLNIWELKSTQRTEIFKELLNEGKLLEIKVGDLKYILFCRAEDLPLIELILREDTFKPRCELIAPLDCMMWDRNLIRTLFGFDYTWEIYTPAHKRKYGFYVLPMLYGNRFIGRVEAVSNIKTHTLTVKNIWYEDGIKQTKKLQESVNSCLKRFAKFNECDKIDFLI
ncbi:DNA glycosylase AlkZ-like family protein [Sedimentibacter sp.]|uniref:winged helix-turn-helix domain-containing protein n=1 Tax=Sedimentibacter sp. TaxID=1960295 RepID=UPI0028AA316B|nr:crosslink repair DNA glycosylase YcaQ family protein [Sedimentibacter sp.]